MKKLINYTHKLTLNMGLSEEKRKDISAEILDHLVLLKTEFVNSGLDEIAAENKAIQQFEQTKAFHSQLSHYAKYNNKNEHFTFELWIKSTLLMILVFFFTLILINIVRIPLMIESQITIAYLLACIGSTFFFLRNLSHSKQRSIVFLFCQFIFLAIIEIILFGLRSYLYSNSIVAEISYLPQLSFILFTFLISYFLYLVQDTQIKIYHYSLFHCILWGFISFLMALYFLVPNRWFFLRKILMSVLNADILHVEKSMFYMVINHQFLIPNIGLLATLLILVIYLLKYKKHHQFSLK